MNNILTISIFILIWFGLYTLYRINKIIDKNIEIKNIELENTKLDNKIKKAEQTLKEKEIILNKELITNVKKQRGEQDDTNTNLPC